MAKASVKPVPQDEDKAVEEQVQSTALTVPGDIDLGADSGIGKENMKAEDFAIPRLGIIQSLSPQRQAAKTEYIPGCVEGQIFLTGGKRVWDGAVGILVVPIAYQRVYLEWFPRKSNKGLAKNHGQDRAAFDAAPQDEFGKHVTAEGNIIIPTAEYFVYVIDETTGRYFPAVLSMGASFMKYAKLWNNDIDQLMAENPKDGKMVPAPIFYQAYKFTTVPVTNEQGSWFRHNIESYKAVKDFPGGWDTYKAALAFHQSIKSGAVKVAEPQAEAAGGGGGASESDEDPM